MLRAAALAGLFLLTSAPLKAQEASRPVPYPVLQTPQFQAAVTAGTRTDRGAPGPNYWQQRTDYDLHATLLPSQSRLQGWGTLSYTNNAPFALDHLVLKLRQNLHAPGVMRNRSVEVTGGVDLEHLTIAGQPLQEQPSGTLAAGGYAVDGTVLTLALAEPLETGASLDVEVAWSFRVPSAGAPRMGQDGEVFYLGYWYPQFAVFDDVYGWHTDPYLGNGEHYMGYGDYDVTVTVPEGWLVTATGELQNPDAVLSEATRARLEEAAASDETVHVVPADDRGPGRATLDAPTDSLTWHFRAQRVRDFAFGTSAAFVWDAQRAEVPGGEAALAQAFYRPGAAAWERASEFTAFSVTHLSGLFLPYPYPHMTSVEGVIGGGMEYPMITLIGGDRTDFTLFRVIYHEISHMWFPMVVGQNEKAFTWMDEGLTSYNTNVGIEAFFDGSAPDRPEMDGWERRSQAHYVLAGTGYAVEPMRHGDRYPVPAGARAVNPVQGSARGVASYSTPAVMLRALEGLYGSERFWEAYREYARRWAFKHPYPHDFYATFEELLGEDLDWMWTSMLYEPWALDHAVAAVVSDAGGVAVTVRDLGLATLPAPVVVTYADGTTEEATVPVTAWLQGARTATLTFRAGEVARVALDPEGYLPDVDPRNNVWTPAPPDEAGSR